MAVSTNMENYTFPINIPTVYNHEFPTRRPFSIQCRLIVLCKINKFFTCFLDLMELGESDCRVMCHFEFLFLMFYYFTKVHLRYIMVGGLTVFENPALLLML